MDRSKYLIKNVGLLTISNFSSKILVFLLVPLYTSVLSTAEYGTFDLVISTVSLLYPILTMNIIDAVMRFTMDESYSKKRVATIGMKYVLISIVIMLAICCVLHIFGIWSGMLVFFMSYYVVYVFNQFFVQFAKGLEKVKDMAISGVISTFSMIVFNLLFLFALKWRLSGFFIAYILSQAMSALYLLIRLQFWQYIETEQEDKLLKKEMLIYCTPLIATVLGWWVNNTLDKYAVTFMCGIAANGLLSVSYKIPSILNTVQSIFVQAWQVSAIKEYGEQDTARFYGNTFAIVNMMMCAVCAGLIFLTRPLAAILYAKDFYVAWRYVPFLLVSSVFNCASGLLGPVLSAKKDTKIMMWSAIIGAGVNAVFNIGLIYFIGIQGATIATVISSLVIYVIRRYGVGKDIVMADRYYLTWIILVIQAGIEVTTENWIGELMLCAFMVVINYKNIAIVFKTAKKVVK